MIFIFRRRIGVLLLLINQLLVVTIWIGWTVALVRGVQEGIAEDRRLGRDPSAFGLVFLAVMGLWILAGVAGTAFWFLRQFGHRAADVRFRSWLTINEEKIRNNELVFYRSKRIMLKTVLVRYHLVCSALFLSGRMHTRWVVLGQEPKMRYAWGAALYSLWNGWWGFPGLIWTPIAIAKNLSSTSTALVEDLLRIPPPPPKGFQQRVMWSMKKTTEDLFITE
jgi:hypothetical protein